MGVFIGIAPLMPFKSMLIILITLATGSSTVAALLVCTFLCNPLTYIPLYYLAWLAGNLLLPGRASWEALQSTVVRVQQVELTEAIALVGQMGFDTGIVLLAGGCLLALPLAFFTYPMVLRFFVQLDRKRVVEPLLNVKTESSTP